MTIRLYRGQIDLISEFLSNMAALWFAAAFIAPVYTQFLFAYSLNGIMSLAAALLLKGVR